MEFDFENQKIIDVDIEREVKKSFMEYAVSVIISPLMYVSLYPYEINFKKV